MAGFENLEVLRLELRSSLFYREDKSLVPFTDGGCGDGTADAGELLFCFEIEEKTGEAIDPDTAFYFGLPVFSGRAPDADREAGGLKSGAAGGPGLFELPAGTYFFAQAREALNRGECILMAVEVQREILWRRLRPANRLYIRRLFEDGKPVTQVWRTFRA
ncbi:MAG: hypothetical protein LBD71_01735 [Treponema sp.]|jgi:hypothetical protein|nr:hypothetical protein [Treponema sp.]